jgi:hypothetical protein
MIGSKVLLYDPERREPIIASRAQLEAARRRDAG